MLTVISPAKTLDYETPATTQTHTLPKFTEHSTELIGVLNQLSVQDVAELMKLSDKLASLNVARFGSWQPEFSFENAKQAILAFKGDVYTGLDAATLTESQLSFAQQHLRILSGLYGLLCPLDLMQPYRLEMGTKLSNPRGKDLYQFWGSLLTEHLNTLLASEPSATLVNLASNEYFKAVQTKKLNARVVTPVFKDQKNGQYKIISFYAKKARGLMVRYAAEQQISEPEELKAFDLEGYAYNAAASNEKEWVFLRAEQK